MSGWIGVDLDGTLAHYDTWNGIDDIGEPIKPMCDRVRKWLAQGKTVKIFTARVHGIGMKFFDESEKVSNKADVRRYSYSEQTEEMIKGPIEEFCLKEFGMVLEITNTKDFGMIELWDDRCVQVVPNTGERIR